MTTGQAWNDSASKSLLAPCDRRLRPRARVPVPLQPARCRLSARAKRAVADVLGVHMHDDAADLVRDDRSTAELSVLRTSSALRFGVRAASALAKRCRRIADCLTSHDLTIAGGRGEIPGVTAASPSKKTAHFFLLASELASTIDFDESFDHPDQRGAPRSSSVIGPRCE